MKTAKNCLKNSKCQLWQVLCDGNPCIVDTEIASNSKPIPKGPKMWHLAGLQSGETIELAEKIEKMGSQFFKKLAKTTSNKQIKNLLLYLAAEEREHQLRFRELGKDITPGVTTESHTGEHLAYVGSTVDTHMFNGAETVEQLVESARSGLDIIKLATDFKKDSILFFNGVRGMVSEDKRVVIDELITEEQVHLVKLTKLRKDIMALESKQILKPQRYLKNNTTPMPLVI